MIAIPPEHWCIFSQMRTEQFWLTLQDERCPSPIVSFCLTSSRPQEEKEKASLRSETSSRFHSSTSGEEKEVLLSSNLLHRRIRSPFRGSGSEALLQAVRLLMVTMTTYLLGDISFFIALTRVCSRNGYAN